MRPDSPPPTGGNGSNGGDPASHSKTSLPPPSDEQLRQEKREALQQLVERYKQRRMDPPVWSRREMFLTTLKILAALLIAMLFLFPFLSVSMRERQNDRMLQRLARDFGQVEATLRQHARLHEAPLEPSEEGTLPEAFVDFFAERQGGAPFYRHQAEMLRFDIYSPGRQYAERLRYEVAGDRWFLISRGPSLEFQTPPPRDPTFAEEDYEAALAPFTYDPTNGVESAGDIWITGRN